ncbi:2'-5' RNA ligase family protein [Labrys okinawensis]|uniref:2'-5' RNA ligase family protein n=1 Tax=Labrys okinawensis TaxID=346911 RepID=UPI0039BC5EC9
MTDMHSVWLMPAAEDDALLSAIVADLAKAFGSEVFTPHLTLVEDRPVEAETLTAQVRAIAAGIAPFTARIEGIKTGETFFRAFYALFEADGPILALKQRAIGSIAASPLSAFMPHVSLAYGVTDTPQRRRLSWEMDQRLAGHSIRFDRIGVVSSAQAIPIAEWQVRASVPLV